MRAVRSSVLIAVALSIAGSGAAFAQPKGPRDVITGARAQQAQREMQQAADKGAEQAGTPPSTGPGIAEDAAAAAAGPQAQGTAATPPGHPPTGASPHGGAGMPAEPKPLSESRVDPSIPAGTIRVRVLDHREQPVVGQKVRIGIMSSDGSRESLENPTGADGFATFGGMQAGENRAYRASIEHEGAKYGANPFRLDPGGGQRITLRRLPVTRDDRMLVLYVGAASVELKDERIKIVQQSRLLNIGSETYVFPEEGTLVRLPEGFLAFQAQESMTDQRLEQAPGEGLRVKGSVPPGEATLMWGFDLPLEGSEAEFAIEMPWRTFAYRVVSDAPDGLSLEVDEMPEPMRHADQGRNFLVTSLQRKIGEEPFRRLHVKLRGIPGPGPWRFIAAALALIAVAAGFMLARRSPEAGTAKDALADQAAHKQALLEEAARLRQERAQDAIGPEYYAEQRRRIEDELAELIFVEERLAKAKT